MSDDGLEGVPDEQHCLVVELLEVVAPDLLLPGLHEAAAGREPVALHHRSHS